jgi:hypothetical protein
MKRTLSFVRASLLLGLAVTGTAFAQNSTGPAIDVSAGFSYLNFTQPASGETLSQSLAMDGGQGSVTWLAFRHLGLEADLAFHQLGDCGGVAGFDCKDLSYMFGPRYTWGDRSNKVTVFVHGLVGQDRADLLPYSPSTTTTLSDTSVALAFGGGLDYWVLKHIGLQVGPFDYFYTNHLADVGGASQSSIRIGGGIAFRFGGVWPEEKPRAPKPQEEGGHRSWIRPWHKTPAKPAEQPEGEEPAQGQATGAGAQNPPEQTPAPASTTPAPSQAPLPPVKATGKLPSHGLAIHAVGVVVGPQEFDGAKVISVEPGSIAEMASLKPGDLIRAVDGKAVRTPMELAAELSGKTGKVTISIVRGKFATDTVILMGVQ